jgi:hypothetical protein
MLSAAGAQAVAVRQAPATGDNAMSNADLPEDVDPFARFRVGEGSRAGAWSRQ